MNQITPPNHGIPLHDFLGFEFDVPTPGSKVAEVHLPVRLEAIGHGTNLHGGAIATLVDLACGLVAASAIGFDITREALVTSDMHVRYLDRAGTDRVTARAEVVREGSRVMVIECRVADGDGQVDAIADYTMMRVPLRPQSGTTDSEVAAD